MKSVLLTLMIVAGVPSLAHGQTAATPPATSPAPPDPNKAALDASMVLEAHCADVAAGTATKSAQALSAVSPSLAYVSEAHDATGEVFLLYWRGRLNLCLDREDRAKEDLEAFITASEGDSVYATQVKEAGRLLRLIERRSKGGVTIETPGLAAAGGALVGGAGALAGLSGWQWNRAQGFLADFEDGGERWDTAVEIQRQGESAVTAQRVFVGAAVAAGVSGVASFVLSTVAPRRGAKSIGAVVLPLERGGVAFTVGGRL